MEQNRTPILLPYVVHEGDMARAERRERRLTGMIVLLIATIVGEWICQRFISQKQTSK